MSDYYNGFFTRTCINCGHEVALGEGVERTCGFIEDNEICIVVKCAGDPNALALTARETNAAFAYGCVVTLWQLSTDKRIDAGDAGGTGDAIHVDLGWGNSEGNVLGDAGVGQEDVLWDIPDSLLPITKSLIGY